MVNIDNFKDLNIPIPQPGKDRISLIFERQKKLMHTYHKIYEDTGFKELTSDILPVNLDTPKGQHLFKYYIYCVYEEVGEAIEAYYHDNKVHYMEELIDGLHFLTEASIYVGFEPKVRKGPSYCRLDNLVYSLEVLATKNRGLENLLTGLWLDLGTCCNTLKQKPWKQTHILTDNVKFEHRLQSVWDSYISLFVKLGCSADQILACYYQKAKVNEFRQDSNY